MLASYSLPLQVTTHRECESKYFQQLLHIIFSYRVRICSLIIDLTILLFVSQDAVKTVGNITSIVMKGVGDSYWVIIGLSLAAYAVEKHLSVGSTEKECREILLNILQLANDVKRVSDVNEMLSNAVGTIVEGAVIFSDYMDLKRGKNCRYPQINSVLCA